MFLFRHRNLMVNIPQEVFRRPLSTSADKSLLLKLRKDTGLSFAVCRDALLKNANDYNQALTWLNEEAVRRGWAKAGRLSNRLLSQGLLGVLSDKSCAVIVEVNCETDFVARNDQFQNLVASITETVMASFTKDLHKDHWTSEDVGSLIIPQSLLSINDSVASVVGAIGEKIAVRRAFGLSAVDLDSTSRLATYSHISSTGVKSAIRDVRFGKYAAAVRYRPVGEQLPTSAWHERAARLGRQLCQHIVGMNPRPGLELTEPASDPEEEQCLLLQPFFLDESVRVMDHLARNDMILEDFIRVECGQSVDDASVTVSAMSS